MHHRKPFKIKSFALHLLRLRKMAPKVIPAKVPESLKQVAAGLPPMTAEELVGGPKALDGHPDLSEDEASTEVNMSGYQAMQVGKYQGRRLSNIYREDKSYIQWVRMQAKNQDTAKMSKGLLLFKAYIAFRDAAKYNRIAGNLLKGDKGKPSMTSGPSNATVSQAHKGASAVPPVRRRTMPNQKRDDADPMEVEADDTPWLRVENPDMVQRWQDMVSSKMEMWERKKRILRNRTTRNVEHARLVVESLMATS